MLFAYRLANFPFNICFRSGYVKLANCSHNNFTLKSILPENCRKSTIMCLKSYTFEVNLQFPWRTNFSNIRRCIFLSGLAGNRVCYQQGVGGSTVFKLRGMEQSNFKNLATLYHKINFKNLLLPLIKQLNFVGIFPSLSPSGAPSLWLPKKLRIRLARICIFSL